MSDYDPQQPPHPPTPPMANPPGQGLAIASLVIGIVSILFSWSSFFAIIFMVTSVVGIVLATSAKKKNAEVGLPAGMAMAALVVNIVALVFSSIGFLACGVCVGCMGLASMMG